MLVAVNTTKLQSLTLMEDDEKLKTIMKWLRFIITLMNMVPMLNAWIFITNKHDSDALHQKSGLAGFLHRHY